jgi:uncharacterized membrane protein YeaQ/YmgE (transglycosylase-associated protein family)
MATELLCIAIGALMGWSFSLFYYARHGAEDAVFMALGVLGALVGRAVWTPELSHLLGWRAFGLPANVEQLLLGVLCAALLLLLSRTVLFARLAARRRPEHRRAGSLQRAVR